MAQIRILRRHTLGLAAAREVAQVWAEEARGRLQMVCTVVAGDTSDTVEFERSGASGSLLVAADHFELRAKLGFVLGAFSRTIEAEITKDLDALLASRGDVRKPAPRA